MQDAAMQSDQSPFTDLSPDTNSNKKSSTKKPTPKHRPERISQESHASAVDSGNVVRYSSTLSATSITRALKQISKGSTNSGDFLERMIVSRAQTEKQRK